MYCSCFLLNCQLRGVKPYKSSKITENKQNKIMQSGFFLLNCQHLSKYPVNPKKKKNRTKSKGNQHLMHIYIGMHQMQRTNSRCTSQ